MSSIQKMIEDLIGEYNADIEKVIWAQVKEIIATTGGFTVDDWILEVKHPAVRSDHIGDTMTFGLYGSARLVPKHKTPREIKESILEGAKIQHTSLESRPGYVNITIKGHQDVDMVVGGSLRFNFKLKMRSSDNRLTGVIEESLHY